MEIGADPAGVEGPAAMISPAAPIPSRFMELGPILRWDRFGPAGVSLAIICMEA